MFTSGDEFPSEDENEYENLKKMFVVDSYEKMFLLEKYFCSLSLSPFLCFSLSPSFFLFDKELIDPLLQLQKYFFQSQGIPFLFMSSLLIVICSSGKNSKLH